MKSKTNKRRLLCGFLALSIVACLFSGIGAFMSGKEKVEDVYTIGKVEVELNSDEYSITDLTPNQEYTFERCVTNTGINPTFVFITLTVPYASTSTLSAADGTPITADTYTQVVQYGVDKAAGVSSKFKLLESGYVGENKIDTISKFHIGEATETKGAVDTKNKTISYVYYYVGDGAEIAELATGESTGNLIDTAKVVNFADDSNMEIYGSLTAGTYAIQSNNLGDSVTAATAWKTVQNSLTASSHTDDDDDDDDDGASTPMSMSLAKTAFFDANPENIVFTKTPVTDATGKTDLTIAKDGSVLGWFDSDTSTYYVGTTDGGYVTLEPTAADYQDIDLMVVDFVIPFAWRGAIDKYLNDADSKKYSFTHD